MRITSAQAAKELRALNDKLQMLLNNEIKASTFVAAISEDIESARPAYDYAGTRKQIREIQERIRKLKHSVSQFNLSQEVPGFPGMTIDQILVYIPQLTAEKSRLDAMRRELPKSRMDSFGRSGSALIEYRYANYDIQQVQADYDAVAKKLSEAQNALDLVNATVEFEAEF